MSNTKEDIKRLQNRAEAGDASAQNSLALAYWFGRGVTKDMQAASFWLKKSAEQGYRQGQHNLGFLYRYGRGIKKNLWIAVKWYEKAANQGDGDAANSLGEIYEHGYKPTKEESLQGISSFSPNVDEAFYWYEKGSSDVDEAKFNLARCYEMGIGTTKNLRKAYELYNACKTEKAKASQERILKDFIPLLDTRLENVSLLRDNPYRILGIWSNSTERERRANQSRINAIIKVGKDIEFPVDHILPCTYADYINLYTNRNEECLNVIDNSEDDAERHRMEEVVLKNKQILETWKQLQLQNKDWNNKPVRDEKHVSEAMQNLCSNNLRIKFAFFWFCNVTDDDKIALNLQKEQKSYAAFNIWVNGNKLDDIRDFSAMINIAMLCWVERHDKLAIYLILKIINENDLRQNFISTICPEASNISKIELSHMFWDALYEFPETELSWREIDKLKESSMLREYLTDDDISYLENKSLAILKQSLDETLQFAESQDKNDFSKSSDAYYKLARIAPYQLLRVKRYLGENDYRYKLLCDNVATKLLQFAIFCNNNNKEWSAPSTALSLSISAERIAVDSTLRERCSRNIDIFKQNKKVASTEKIIEKINKAISNFKEDSNLDDLSKLIKDIDLYLQCLCSENGNKADIYLKISDESVNRILNIIIRICNNHRNENDLLTATNLIKDIKKFPMSTQTKGRIERNEEILANNRIAAMMSQSAGTPSRFKRKKKDSLEMSASERKEMKSRRMHKSFVSILSLAIISSMVWYLSWGNNWNYFMEVLPAWGYFCVVLIIVVTIFNVVLWVLEKQIDPYDSELYWLDTFADNLNEIGEEITNFGARDGKTYSWPFAIPFQLLALIIIILRYPLKWMAKLAIKIK